MTATTAISVLAVVTSDERIVVQGAAQHVAGALSEITGESWSCQCEFAHDLPATFGRAANSHVVVTSLGVPLADINLPWGEVEDLLRGSYAALCQIGTPVMICTLLRHVSVDVDSQAAAPTLRRLRQLNLLATELSREYGAFVIDLDRILGHIGAFHLNTDYRLRGVQASDVAGRAIARGIISNALDGLVPVNVQNAASALLDQRRSGIHSAASLTPTNVVAMGRGRRKQLVSTITDTVQQDHVGWLVGQVLARHIGPGEAIARFFKAIRRRGARESALLLISGLTRLFRSEQVRRRR
jgi:hypothetical protein